MNIKYWLILSLFPLLNPNPARASEHTFTADGYQMTITLSMDHTGDTAFIFDDGTCEDGWAINPGYVGWFGNLFPVPAGTAGILKSFELYFLPNQNGRQQQLSVNVFNENYQLIGSSSSFLAVEGVWLSVNVNNISFSGPFYVMVKWNNLTESSHWLGLDTDGPYSSQNLARYYDGQQFQLLSETVGSNPGSFLIRAHAAMQPQGIDDIIINQEVSVFPNPASEYIEVFSAEKMESLKIIDLSGKSLINIAGVNQERQMVDLSALKDGLYLLLITTAKGTSVEKISVSH